MISTFTINQPQTTINHNTGPQQPNTPNLDEHIQAVVEMSLNNCLMYRVQCVTCEEAGILMSVDKDTVRDWIKSGKLAASKVGREWAIRVMDIDRMLTKNATVVNLKDRRFKSNKHKN